ncbi:MAG: nicotinate phosphoribosyltransferase [Tenericutes bacterium]|nr:nicotinate phosphoribosyltransferase [Mycoplasmatota bacterium]
MKLEDGYVRLNKNYSMLTDQYELNMANSYFESGMKDTVGVFDVFFRKVPSNGGYALMAGVDKVIEYINNLKFNDNDLAYFKSLGYGEEFINYLKDFKFTGNIYAIPDGTPVFPNEPILTVEAPLIEAQIIETAVLSLLNGAMEHATGARRIIEATPKNVKVMEFGARRADGLDAAIDASLYGVMAGCSGTSNVIAANMIGQKALGTQAHSYIESFDSEYEAFLAYAKSYPNETLLLVDTYDTLRSGIPNAIRVAKEYLIPNGYRLKGIRIDSGDLAYLSKMARKMLDDAGLNDATICLSNGLNANTIRSLTEQGARFDSLGVGDNISKPEGRMGCVYKEVAILDGDKRIPKIKVSEDPIKTINPDFKDLYRLYDNETGYALADVMVRRGEKLSMDNLLIIDLKGFINQRVLNNFRTECLQKEIFVNGKQVFEDLSINELKEYVDMQMSTIYPEVKREVNPHVYNVSGTNHYAEFKKEIIGKVKRL